MSSRIARSRKISAVEVQENFDAGTTDVSTICELCRMVVQDQSMSREEASDGDIFLQLQQYSSRTQSGKDSQATAFTKLHRIASMVQNTEGSLPASEIREHTVSSKQLNGNIPPKSCTNCTGATGASQGL